MNKLVSTLAVFTLVMFSTYAQIDSLINSGNCIAKARQLSDSGKYELAIKELNRIDPRDTNYVYSLSEKAKALINHEQYKESIAVCEQGLKTRSPYRSSLFNSLALSYQGLGMFDQALASLNDGLKEFPFEYNLMYRIGIVWYVQGQFDKAEEQFFKTLEYTPLLLGSHLYLSKIAMRRGNKVEGMFAMGIYLALNNDVNSQLKILENFVKNELIDEQTIPQGSFVNPFSRLDEFIRAKISFEEGYELKIPIDVGIVRQYQLLFDQLGQQSYPADSPWVRFYLKIYDDLAKAGVQVPFVYYILQSSSIKDVKRWADNNKKVLQQFYDVINNSVKQFRGKRSLPEKWGYKNPVACSYDDDSSLESIGDKDGAGNKIGKWYYFGSNGALLAIGNYTQNKKVGQWHYFSSSGLPSSDENYDTNEINFYNKDGTIEQHYFLKDKNVEGKFELFYSCGALSEVRSYHEGKKNGPGRNYYPNGKLKTEFEFKDGEYHDAFIKWYESGSKESDAHYLDGKAVGRYVSYFANGKVKAIGNYEDGKASGPWSYYFENGRLKQKGDYQADSLVGLWETYNERGALTVKSNYKHQEDFDEEDEYFNNGILSEVVRIKEDKVVGLIYYNKSGAVVASYNDKKGTFKGKSHFPTGEIRAEFEYVDGKRAGQWKFHSRYGILETVSNYKNGLLEGENEDYHSSGALKIKSTYVEGKLDGLFTEYHSNGKVMNTGWYTMDQKQQLWKRFYVDGTMESDQYFLNDEAVGYELQFSENNKLESRYDYDSEGRIKSITKYNENGLESIMDTTGVNHRSVMVQKNQPGTISYKAEYACGDRDGETTLFLATGKPYRKLNYRNGNLTGNYTSNFPNGSPDCVGQYLNGSLSGIWKWNNLEGINDCVGGYLDGQRDSLWTNYHYNGKKASSINYLNGERDGETQIFGLDEQLVLVKKFDDGDLVAYKIFTKEGKMSDWISFKGDETITSHYANGQTAITESYKNGQYHGQRKKFYPNGQLYSYDDYRDGDANGDSFIYYPNGKLKEKAFYKNDKLEGAREYYDATGNLIQRELYRSGSFCGQTEFFTNGKASGKQNFFNAYPLD